MTDPRELLGFVVHHAVTGPYHTRSASRTGTGDDGGTLDCAIIAQLPDGTRIIIGEIWAACPDSMGNKHRINANEIANKIAITMNKGEL